MKEDYMDPTASVLFSHFTSAAVVVYLIQLLKSAKWFPWLQNEGQITLKRIVSIAGALGAHTGITYAWHSLGAGTATGGYQFIVTLPPLSVVAAFVWRWAGQWIMQEGWYKIVYNKVAQIENIPVPAPQITKP
jgi:hypothetical protein